MIIRPSDMTERLTSMNDLFVLAHMSVPHVTVDYATVISGEIWLILDDGAEFHLTPGDCLVQNGTQHAWQNRNSAPCMLAGVTVGAKRQGSSQ